MWSRYILDFLALTFCLDAYEYISKILLIFLTSWMVALPKNKEIVTSYDKYHSLPHKIQEMLSFTQFLGIKSNVKSKKKTKYSNESLGEVKN